MCVRILLRDVGCHGYVSVRFGSGCSEMSGAKDSKAVLSCEWTEERSLLLLAFLPPGSGKGTPESGDGQSE